MLIIIIRIIIIRGINRLKWRFISPLISIKNFIYFIVYRYHFLENDWYAYLSS